METDTLKWDKSFPPANESQQQELCLDCDSILGIYSVTPAPPPKNNLVGGFNPFEKYYKVKLDHFPGKGENKTYLKPPPSNQLNHDLIPPKNMGCSLGAVWILKGWYVKSLIISLSLASESCV